jgi:hypothetical protein
MRNRIAILLLAVGLAACSFGKQTVTVQNELAVPPWETFTKAGKGAEYEIDLETLNGPDKTAVAANVDGPAPSQADLEANAEPTVAADPKPKAPDAVAIKSVAVVPVQGMDNRSNGELTAAMRDVLQEAGWPVIDKPSPDALVVEGHVALAAVNGPNQRVTLTWSVKTPKGTSLGDVSQANDVPAGSLNAGWGENAKLASQAAADGIFKLIEKYR